VLLAGVAGAAAAAKYGPWRPAGGGGSGPPIKDSGTNPATKHTTVDSKTELAKTGSSPTVPTSPPEPARSFAALDPADVVDGKPRVLVQKTFGSRFVLIPGGTFDMGDADASEAGAAEDRPAHAVTLSDYYLQETEVTNRALVAYFQAKGVAASARPPIWRKAVETLKEAGRDPDNHPAVGVPRDIVEDFAAWAGARLVTEAQWEYAARSRGKAIAQVWGSAAGASKTFANLNTLGDFDEPTTEVGVHEKDRTEQGVLDMAGNVREWCRDRWAYYAKSDHPARDPEGPPARAGATDEFVVRGGSFATFADAVRTTRPRRPRPDLDGSLTADELAKNGAASDLGFRLVVEGGAVKGGSNDEK
jgi:serine/threonine-protein kinase